ncbi:hypothetical protein [Azospirillum sp. sgz302134]
MSYLTGPRLNFTGKFIADVSTVNNYPNNYERKRYTAEDYADWNIGYWNPYGTGVWRLTDCVVTNAVNADGSSAAGDPVLGMAVTDADDQPPAKLVDLDTEQQSVSAIWGMILRLASRDGKEAVRGNFAVASFTDLWTRTLAQDPTLEHPLHSPSLMGACWQSVLTDLAWGDVGPSPFLASLREAAEKTGLLSIKFNVVGYNGGYDIGSDGTRYLPNPPDFTTGLITGTIGIATADEPRFFTLGRKLQPTQSNSTFNYATAVVNEARKSLSIDLGNSIAFQTWRGAIVGDTLQVGYFESPPVFRTLGEVKPDNAWYERTAGICEFALTDAQLAAIASSPLAVYDPAVKTVLAQEPPDGKMVRADQFVFRMSPGETAPVTLWATRFGKPLAGAAVASTYDTSGLTPGAGGVPAVGTPESALQFPSTVTTDAAGKATLTLTAQDPGEPRKADDIDGQVYGVRPALADATATSYHNASDFVSVLVWSGYDVPEEPTWEADIKPILTQYANLYPVMLPVLDMGDYDSVCKHLYALQFAMSLPEENPNYMPAVRDLSPAKKTAILKWATNPVRGEPTEPAPKAKKESPALAAVTSALHW